MDSPDDRGRPEAKGLLRYRSRSAGNFKNSPFYEKFIFFENNAPVKARYSNEIPKIAGESSKDSKGHGVDASSTILYSRDHGTTNRGRAQTERQNKQSRSRELSKDEAPHLYLKRASDINARPLSQSVVELARSSKYASISLEYERPHDIIDLRGQLDFVLPHPKHGSSGKKLQSKSPLPLSCSAETISCSSSFAEKFDRTNEQDPCPSIVSSEIAGTSLSSSISVPCLEALRADESPVRKTSTASIHLSNPQSASKKEERGRKIHVIKTRHSMPHMSIEPSPRLDEWLSSVMKLHTERRRTESWAFPEDDFTCLSFHSPSQPTKIGCSNITSASAKQLPPHNTNPAGTKHPREYWPPQAADNSFSYLSNSGDRSSHASEKTYVFSQTPLPGRKISEQGGSYGPSSSYCSLCCTFHSNQRCSHANHSTNRPLSSKPCACESSSGHYTGEELNKSTSYCIHGTSNVKMPHMCCQITPNVDKLKSSGETLIKCSKSEADLVNPGITIRVTGDEDLCGDSSMKTSCPDCFESSNIVVSESADYVPRGKEITERSILVKGTSPHYIFPGRYLTCDKDSESRDPFSPRNSVGSITSNTSAYSYKSSNADSAVDLCPPDDDQDFEYADFLAKHQAKRFSQADDNGALIEGIPSIDASVIDSLRSLSYTENAEILELSSLNITTPFQQSNCYNVKQELEDYESYIPPHLQDRISIHENEFAVSEQKIESYDSASRRHSASEMSTSRDILLSALDNLRISQKRSEYHTDVTEDRFVESQQRQFFLHDTSTEIMKNSHFNADLDKKQHEEHTYLTQQRHLIPELIVSDHSHYNDEPEKSSCLDELELDSESPLPSRPESSMSYGESSLLDIEERGLLRADSVSSVYSVASTCSTCGYLSEHEVPPCAGGKVSDIACVEYRHQSLDKGEAELPDKNDD